MNRTRTRELAEQLLRNGEAAHWSEAYEMAARELSGAAARPEPDSDTVAEAAGKLFGDRPPGPEVTDEDVAEAAGRLFGEGRNLSEVTG